MNETLLELLDCVQRTAVQVGSLASDAAYSVGRKAEELLSVAKLRMNIATLEGQVKDALAEVGGMLYATHTGDPTDSDVLLAKLEEIDGLKAQLRELQDQLGCVQAYAFCPTCGAIAQEGDQFCRECGGKI